MIHGVGVDLVHLDRFRRFLDDHSARLGEMFTPGEIAARPRVMSLAAAFAIKEAALKAIGGLTGWELDWREIEAQVAEGDRSPSKRGRRSPSGDGERRVAIDSGGAAVTLSGSVEKHARALSVGALHATLSRSGERVIATVIAERRAR